jgi:DNA helicase-2/ATP-dependent DNA helicase PcrA
MKVELVSRRRRRDALVKHAPEQAKVLGRGDALLDALAEYQFTDFRDERTPASNILDPLLRVVQVEQRAGRLTFDDFGALFWELLHRYPSVDAAYRAHYPIVIADEHQDASALQDAVTRRLASQRLTIFADPMQLIHGFRGASPARLARHLAECDAHHSLSTPHRWRGSREIGAWLLAVRARLERRPAVAPRPSSFSEVLSPGRYGFNGTLNPTKLAVLSAFKSGRKSIAVLARTNDEAAKLRDYLSREHLYPRQIGSTEDFEEAREVIEALPLLESKQGLAHRALAQLAALVPTLSRSLLKQLEKRLGLDGVHRKGCGADAAGILEAFAPLYSGGPLHFFSALSAALEVCAQAGYHLPRVDAVRAVRETADVVPDHTDLEEILQTYAQKAGASIHTARRVTRGLFVMTAHQAKGKEFDAVVLVNATERNFPDTEDGRQLFYVAITRATDEWTIIAPAGAATSLLASL